MSSMAKSKSKDEGVNWFGQFVGALCSIGMVKPSQGKVVRQVTFFALAILFALLAWEIGIQMPKLTEMMGLTWKAMAVHYTTFGIFLILGAWISYRIINIPAFADFLIGTEAEMRKVTWPTKMELYRGSVVVMVVVLGLAAAMFAFDIIWASFFRFIGAR